MCSWPPLAFVWISGKARELWIKPSTRSINSMYVYNYQWRRWFIGSDLTLMWFDKIQISDLNSFFTHVFKCPLKICSTCLRLSRHCFLIIIDFFLLPFDRVIESVLSAGCLFHHIYLLLKTKTRIWHSIVDRITTGADVEASFREAKLYIKVIWRIWKDETR